MTDPSQMSARERRDFLKWQRGVIDASHQVEKDLSRLQGFKNVAYLIASALPLYWVYKIFEVMAGHNTTFNSNVQWSFTLSGGLGLGWANEVRRTRSERRELKRVRERLKVLEGMVEENLRHLEG